MFTNNLKCYLLNIHTGFIFLVNCTWSDWSDCSTTCGPGLKTRTIAEGAKFGGKPCDGLNKTSCNLKDCVLGENFFPSFYCS